MARFDVERFVADCCDAAAADQPVPAVRDVVARAVSDPAAVEAALGHLVDETYGTLHISDAITIQHGIFPPGYQTGIHDHTISAVIGTWGGYEDNHFFRRSGPGGEIVAAGGKRCGEGDVLVLGRDAIHDVHAPADRWSAGFHVYLGNLWKLERSMWPGCDAPPDPYDGAAFIARWLGAIEAAGLRKTAQRIQ